MDSSDLQALYEQLWMTLAAGMGFGAVTMAAVQLVKDLTPLRELWQQTWIQGLVDSLARKSMPYAEDRPKGAAALADLERLAVAGHQRALYGLPIEQLAGQLNAAAQAVLDFPERHDELLQVLASGADEADIGVLRKGAPSTDEKSSMVAFVDARNRVGHQVQRNLDALQVGMSFRWKLYLQLVSLVASTVFAVIAAAVLAPTALHSFAGWMAIIVIGLLGGFLATVVRDLVASLQNLRS